MSVTARPDTETPQGFDIRPVSDVLGAEIVGLDLRGPLDTATREAVSAAFLEYQLLVFRDQDLDKPQQIAFTEQFGTLERHIGRNRGADLALVHMVSNLGADGKPSGKVSSTGWHSDKSFRPQPSMATVLHAKQMPPEGGDTCFADMYGAYAALPASEKAELSGIEVVHSWQLSREKKGLKATADEIRDAPPMIHPLVRRHPDSGRECLFMGEHASHFAGRPMAEGRARLAALTEHATAPRFVYRHRWRGGDLLMWDNRCLLHRVDPNFEADRYPRVLHRTCLRGTAPG